MGNYPSTEEVLSSMEQEAPKAQESQESAPKEVAEAPVKQENPYLDFDQYKGHLIKYKADNREVSEPLEMVLKRAGLGYHAAQRLEGIKSKESEYQKAIERAKQLERWEQYDAYAKQNPAWAQHVEKTWAERERLGQDTDDLSGLSPQLVEKLLSEKLAPWEEKFSKVDSIISTTETRVADQALDKEIAGVKEQFKTVDFDEADEHGQTKEYLVLKHMTENGIKNFRTAFLDLFHDDLLKREVERAKEQGAKERQKMAKQGIIGVSSTPRSAQATKPSNVKAMSYEQLAELAKREMAG